MIYFYDIHLNFTHRPIRYRLQILKNEAESIKLNLVDNLVKNIKDHNIFEYPSAFDFHHKINLEERCTLLVIT